MDADLDRLAALGYEIGQSGMVGARARFVRYATAASKAAHWSSIRDPPAAGGLPREAAAAILVDGGTALTSQF